jgi:glycine/D-amino acid oxidase-like deaminating enzyme
VDLKSGYPFWAVKNGLMYAFPCLQEDMTCDVLVIGGGITGALIARSLAEEGLDTVVVEERDVAWGSTAASTAMLQYEIDTHLVDLAKQYGEKVAAQVYTSCVSSIGMIADVAGEVRDVDFRMNDSLYVASSRWHERKMRDEFDLRRKHGLPVKWLTSGDVKEKYDIDAPCAILSTVGAQADPYRMASRLLHALAGKGVRVFDRTIVQRFDTTDRSATAVTTSGLSIRARHIVFATGYATQQWIDEKLAVNRSSYAMVTDPIASERLGPWKRTLFWESARPYLYARSTRDGRLVVGGEDDKIDIPARRDARVESKSRTLMKRARALFACLPLEPAFAWAGTFAETPDGLPYFGAHPQHGSRVLFAMAYGGNGITYSALGAELLAATIKRRAHPLRHIFGFSRGR